MAGQWATFVTGLKRRFLPETPEIQPFEAGCISLASSQGGKKAVVSTATGGDSGKIQAPSVHIAVRIVVNEKKQSPRSVFDGAVNLSRHDFAAQCVKLHAECLEDIGWPGGSNGSNARFGQGPRHSEQS